RDQGGSVCRGPPRVRGPRSRRPAGVLAGTIRRHERCGEGGGEGNRAEGRGGGWGGGRRRGRACGEAAVGVAGLGGWRPSVRSSSAKWWESGRLTTALQKSAPGGGRRRPVAADGAR